MRDDMLELDFEQYDCTMVELKEFVGMKNGTSVYYEDGASIAGSAQGTAEEDGQSEQESPTFRSTRERETSGPTPRTSSGKGKDVR